MPTSLKSEQPFRPGQGEGPQQAAAETVYALVLIVDDDREVLDLTADLVTRLGYSVMTARTGEEALHLLRREERISVLFSDIRLPGMAGEELAREATQMRPGLRIVFTSGHRRPLGMARFLPKPYRISDLAQALAGSSVPVF